ncbi:MAG: alpha/beta fold hydrolase, partial [Erysipelotrichaceae bacterium]
MPVININDLDLYYEVIGNGKPLIMVHGNGEDHRIFDKAVNLLKNSFTCYLIDSRGHGKSQKVKEYHYADMADDVYKFISALNLKDVTYYGFSDGGIIGLLLAINHGDVLKRMIISGANTNPNMIKPRLVKAFRFINRIHYNPLFALMLNEPDIKKEELEKINIPVLVLAGSKDLVLEEDSRFIAGSIPYATLKILKGEGHTSYIVHSEKIA